MNGKRILLVIGGGIAAYKSCELIRLIRKAGGGVTCVLTDGGAQFVTPMTLAALSEAEVYSSLWDLKNETEMGHIQLSREADLIVVCPATADLMAKMAAGIADDLATTLLLATDTQVMAVPAMNVRMWDHAATQRNVGQLRDDGVIVLDPDEGPMACGEFGEGRLPEPDAIFAEIEHWLASSTKDRAHPLAGKRVVITAGPTREPIDPVRYIANRSSGRQGYAIAGALARLGANVSLISGPVALETPRGVNRIDVETALEMEAAVDAALPADVAILVAAVADWRAEASPRKIKKGETGGPPDLNLIENPDILAGLSRSDKRPELLIGFAAETDKVVGHAKAKLDRKGCDWIIANDVSGDVMGGADNSVHIITEAGVESWEQMPKSDVARKLAERIADVLA
ncbi:bifunctional phosphopantothenoylcysteine decarboxylase/phosphopantothenate--cysteine ligase CoaBC [Parasphingopyxis sp. CP4]|uniref:bifunctional phosphopantothenoylcysteine decarboxylase/phosphopantothenate--cysteine ligase CoaBC n=1 Tax=Parasphingopyxis sp. CP4 TaxID=2724527 RepID=UPI001C40AF7C|nr:bifunctional phosphopantothenoylcysteine decarboxylase/phosphopantothenate--cysteine ligase CoaBC [Parasphingopyxis sp. CP4]QLC21739.1 bifunctional phosphopantothenoylcysteine decarboxylase/phosphopantothenate--cysteine ligase CoaBC [Parasphingopyxis sp. CP4]